MSYVDLIEMCIEFVNVVFHDVMYGETTLRCTNTTAISETLCRRAVPGVADIIPRVTRCVATYVCCLATPDDLPITLRRAKQSTNEIHISHLTSPFSLCIHALTYFCFLSKKC